MNGTFFLTPAWVLRLQIFTSVYYVIHNTQSQINQFRTPLTSISVKRNEFNNRGTRICPLFCKWSNLPLFIRFEIILLNLCQGLEHRNSRKQKIKLPFWEIHSRIKCEKTQQSKLYIFLNCLNFPEIIKRFLT